MVTALCRTPVRAVSVLLGGSGVCRRVGPAQRDIAALLQPRKGQAGGNTAAPPVARLWERRHD